MKQHPGVHVREHILPNGLSVKDAAKLLGVGRPALSNFLNGRAALSREMAARLEKTFGADAASLLDMQKAFESDGGEVLAKEVLARAYVPSFLSIKANEIEAWASENIEARTQLSVLLRTLIHSTTVGLSSVDFPGFDNAERKGWDGFVQTDSASPWVPLGASGWEFGCNKDPQAKANKDYAARTRSINAEVRAQTTFVFVTPHNWLGKSKWLADKQGAGLWKAVKAFDASDLEQWAEQSVSAQIWLSEKIGRRASGIVTLEECWRNWSLASEPAMHEEIFTQSVNSHRLVLLDWLNSPPRKPLFVSADSGEEALAFLKCLFDQADPQIVSARDKVAVFHSPEPLRVLSDSTANFIPIVTSEEAERQLGTVYRRVHSIVVKPRNSVEREVDIALDLLGHEAFDKALTAMNIEASRFGRLGRESGRSPTILRRRLSKIDAVRIPTWASSAPNARKLAPLAFVGAWNSEAKADCEIVSYISETPYADVESAIAEFLSFDDCPVWAQGKYRGVASKIDALFSSARFVTKNDIDNFFFIAENVLAEADPALELPDDERWAAGLYGKTRNHSRVLRQGVCETLVILAVHGNHLFRERLGVDVRSQVSMLVRRLLTPLTLERLLSNDADLPHYAEAAPEEFLGILSDDLRQSQPVVLGLLRPVNPESFGAHPSRTGLLWALECLAWAPENLGSVAMILSELAQIEIRDNWLNKPENSLKAIFKSWMPQTTAPVEQRVKLLATIAKRFPRVGWDLCMDQIHTYSQTGHYNYKPKWRSDASGDPVTVGERNVFVSAAVELALSWPEYDETKLGDLVERLTVFSENDQMTIWSRIEVWAETAGDDAKAALRERIRKFAFTRRGRRRDIPATVLRRAREVSMGLVPKDVVVRHSWLFVSEWVEESAEEIDDEELDFRERDKKIAKLRVEAIADIWKEKGLEGIERLWVTCGAPHVVGQAAASLVDNFSPRHPLFAKHRQKDAPGFQSETESFLRGFLYALSPEKRKTTLAEVIAAGDNALDIFVCSPFSRETWEIVEAHGKDFEKEYWRYTPTHWNRFDEQEISKLIDNLLAVGRARAAFHAVHLDWELIETSRLKRLLSEIPQSAEQSGTYRMSSSDLAAALEELNKRPDVSVEEMARLEFLYLSVLDHTDHAVTNLEKQIADAPLLFAQAVALAFRRRDGGEDEPGWRVQNPEHEEATATAAYRLLDNVARVPGTDCTGGVQAYALKVWMSEARKLCKSIDREDIGDQMIGRLLANAPADDRGFWPCTGVCEAMEEIPSEHIRRGFQIAVFNSRGAHYRREGGDQEREIATRYKAWAEEIAGDFPYVASVLGGIATHYLQEAERNDSDAKVRRRIRE